MWGPDRYLVEDGDVERLVKYCSRPSNQCQNWPAGFTWEDHSLLILQWFEQQLVYDFTHGFSRLADYCRRECNIIHTHGRLLTRLRQSTRGAARSDELKYLQLPRRMRTDCPPATESADQLLNLEATLRTLLNISESDAATFPAVLPDSSLTASS